MLTAIRVPALDSSSSKATFCRALVCPGQVIACGTVVFEIETEKASFPVESPCAGTVTTILAQPGSEITVGDPLVILDTDDTSAEPFTTTSAHPQGHVRKGEAHSYRGRPARQLPSANHLGALAGGTPAVHLQQNLYTCTESDRVLFNEHALRSAPLISSQPIAVATDKITADAYAAKNVPIAEKRALTGGPLRTAQRMLWSALNIPVSSVTLPLDIGNLQMKVDAHRQVTRKLLNTSDVIIWAAARAIRGFPELNAYRHDNELRIYSDVNLGLVYDIKGELVVPSIANADKLNVREMAENIRSIFRGLTARKLPPALLGIATFTVSNLWGSGVTHATPIVNAGQTGVLLVGTPFLRPVSHKSGIGFVQHVNLILGFDHSVVNGLKASAFLKAVAQLLTDVKITEDE